MLGLLCMFLTLLQRTAARWVKHSETGGLLNLHKIIVKIPDRIAVGIDFSLGEAVAHERKSVVGAICDVVILPADVFHNLEEMQSAARIDCCDWAMCLPVLEPASASRRPNQSLHQFVSMSV